MLEPIMHVLNTQRIVLASGSPRRKTILENIVIFFFCYTLLPYCIVLSLEFKGHINLASDRLYLYFTLFIGICLIKMTYECTF